MVSPTQRRDRSLGAGLRVAVILAFLWMTRDLLPPVALGGFVALLLHPLRNRLYARFGRLRRLVPGLLTTATVIVLVIPSVGIATRLAFSFQNLTETNWSATLDSIEQFVASQVGFVESTFGISTGRLRSAANQVLGQIGNALGSAAGELASMLPAQILALFLFVLALYFFLRDGDRLRAWLAEASPFPEAQTNALFGSIRDTVRGALLGVIASALVQGALMLVALYSFRIPGAFVFGVAAMVLAVIPIVGTTPVSAGAVIYLLAVDRVGSAIGMAATGLAVGAADNIVRPWVQRAGGKTLHPLFVLLGIFGGLSLFGFTGVFLGPVLTAIAVWSLSSYRKLRTESETPRVILAGESPPRPGGDAVVIAHAGAD